MDNRVRLKIQNSLALHQRCQLASHLQNIFLVLLYYMPMWNRISHFLIWCGRLESCQLGRHSRAKLKCDWETNWHLYWNARKNLILRRTLNWIIQNTKLKNFVHAHRLPIWICCLFAKQWLEHVLPLYVPELFPWNRIDKIVHGFLHRQFFDHQGTKLLW